MHDTDGEHEIEGLGWQWELFEVGLEEADAGQVLAESGGFIDGAGVVCSGDECTGVAAEQCVSSTAAAGIKYGAALEGFRGDAGFGLEGGVVFGFVSNVEAGPLKAEGFEVQIGDEAWYVVDDGGDDCAVGVDESGAVAAELERGSGAGLLQWWVLWRRCGLVHGLIC